MTPDALSMCNGCDFGRALPDNAAGYCEDCESKARGLAQWSAYRAMAEMNDPS